AHYSGPRVAYRGYEGSLHIPADISDLVEGVFGLDDRPQARPRLGRAAVSGRTPTPRVANGLSGVDIAKAYMFPSATGAGQTIGFMEWGGVFLTSDVESYSPNQNLTPPMITSVSVDMATNNPGMDARNDGEVALDIQVAGSCAPGAEIVVYFAPITDAG